MAEVDLTIYGLYGKLGGATDIHSSSHQRNSSVVVTGGSRSVVGKSGLKVSLRVRESSSPSSNYKVAAEALRKVLATAEDPQKRGAIALEDVILGLKQGHGNEIAEVLTDRPVYDPRDVHGSRGFREYDFGMMFYEVVPQEQLRQQFQLDSGDKNGSSVVVLERVVDELSHSGKDAVSIVGMTKEVVEPYGPTPTLPGTQTISVSTGADLITNAPFILEDKK